MSSAMGGPCRSQRGGGRGRRGGGIGGLRQTTTTMVTSAVYGGRRGCERKRWRRWIRNCEGRGEERSWSEVVVEKDEEEEEVVVGARRRAGGRAWERRRSFAACIAAAVLPVVTAHGACAQDVEEGGELSVVPADIPIMDEAKATVVEPAVFGSMHNDTLAYTIKYPVKVRGVNDEVRWVTTRPPEKYSSAPPLTTDARQRLVYEAINFKDALTATVSVGPPAPESPLLAVLEDAEGKRTPVRPQDVRVKDFVLAVLLDRVAAPRRPDGTRSTIARLEEYERVPAGRNSGATPTSTSSTSSSSKDESSFYFRYIYTVDYPSSYTDGPGAGPRTRRVVASTALRDGYLYTYSLSCPVTRWEEYGQSIVTAVNDFEIDDTADARSKSAYVSPESAPWAIF